MTLYFSEEHEWLDVDGDTARLGITAHAAEQLGDVVFVELKDAGETFDKDDEIGVIESVKAASDIYAPVDGEILEANEALVDEPAKVNESPEGDAWMYVIKITDPSQLEDLMDANAYKDFTS